MTFIRFSANTMLVLASALAVAQVPDTAPPMAPPLAQPATPPMAPAPGSAPAAVPGAPPPSRPATAAAAQAAVTQLLERSVVKIFNQRKTPELSRPWSKASTTETSGSGVVISGNRIITNAHVVAYASEVQVQAHGSADKITARVTAIAHDVDLAVLTLDDPAFFNSRPPIQFANALPELRQEALAYGYPMGGNALSITRGIVSRIEFVPGTQSGLYDTRSLRIQVDVPLNPGNSGGPVLAGGRLIGLATAIIQGANNIGYVIPTEEIELFLKDVADGKYDGKPELPDAVAPLQHPALRRYLKLPKDVSGAVVVRADARTGARPPLKEWDVITHIGEHAVGNDGMVQLGNLRVAFQYRVQQLARNGKLPLTVIRNGKPLTLEVPVIERKRMLINSLNGLYPDYFIYGPIVFTRASLESAYTTVLSQGSALPMMSSRHPLLVDLGSELGADKNDPRQELVMVAAPFFTHRSVIGYDSPAGSVVESINNVPVRSLAHLVELLRDSRADLLTIRFADRGSETVVLRRKDMAEATDTVLNENSIRSQGSPELLRIWNKR
jgi:S1-C subfamily serine protease